jgi:hypothetical protein
VNRSTKNNESLDSLPSTGRRASSDDSDELLDECSEVIRAYKAYGAADSELNRIVAVDPSSPNGMAAHKRWKDACASMAKLPAKTTAELRLKAQMLISVLEVVSGGDDNLELHERLALSLARDLVKG